jgi:hypothetical protein
MLVRDVLEVLRGAIVGLALTQIRPSEGDVILKAVRNHGTGSCASQTCPLGMYSS